MRRGTACCLLHSQVSNMVDQGHSLCAQEIECSSPSRIDRDHLPHRQIARRASRKGMHLGLLNASLQSILHSGGLRRRIGASNLNRQVYNPAPSPAAPRNWKPDEIVVETLFSQPEVRVNEVESVQTTPSVYEISWGTLEAVRFFHSPLARSAAQIRLPSQDPSPR